jgi:tetratricopeptide (TPR) repeat protein
MRHYPRSWAACWLAVVVWATAAQAADSGADLLAHGRVDDAIQALNGEIRTAPRNSKSLGLLCRAYFSLGQWDRAASACEKAIALDENSAEYHLWLGRTYGEKADATNFLSAAGLAKKSRAELEKAVGLDPFHVEAHTDLAEFYLEAPGIVGGGRDKARAQADILMKLSPTHAHWVYGRIAEKDKDGATAEKEYRAMIDGSKGSAWSWLSLGLYFKHNNQLDPMEEALKHVAGALLDRPESLVDAASTLYKSQRNLPLAAQLVRRYLQEKPNEQAPVFKAHYLLGNILEKQGDKNAAADEYRTSLSLAKEYGPAQEALKRVSG